MMPLPGLFGARAEEANEIRWREVSAALARGVPPAILDAKLRDSWFHAESWLNGQAVTSLRWMRS